MPLPNVLEIGPGENGFNDWIFSHARDHQEILQAVQKQKSVSLTEYELDLFNPDDPHTWLQSHQQAHNDFNNVLGVAGNDLESVDFKNQNQVKAWIWLNFIEHNSARSILKI